MKPGRYSADLIMSGHLDSRNGNPYGPRIKGLISNSMKFVLPVDGAFFDVGRLPSPAVIRLPYPSIVCEFDATADDGSLSPFVFLAVEEDGGSITGFVAAVHYLEGWIPIPAYDRFISMDEKHLIHTNRTWWGRAFEEHEKEKMNRIADPLLSKGWTALFSLIEILECSNVRTERVEVPAPLAKKRARRGEPSFTYHVLTIPGGSDGHEGRSGSHASPRQHLRRGHIRRLANDRKIWINACVVGSAKNGVVEKDYQVVKPC